MSIRSIGDVDAARFASAERLATLEEVLAWCHAQAAAVVEVVVQDEFTHDVIVRTAELPFLVFDTT